MVKPPVEHDLFFFINDDFQTFGSIDLNGKTIHLVERTQPPPPNAPTQADSQTQHNATSAYPPGNANEETNIFIGGFPMNAPGGQNPAAGIQTFIQQIFGGLTDFGGPNGANVNVTAGTANPAGSQVSSPNFFHFSDSNLKSFSKRNVGLDIQIDLSNMSQTVNEEEIRMRINGIKRLLNLARLRLDRLRVCCWLFFLLFSSQMNHRETF
jgi:hypothetical protein